MMYISTTDQFFYQPIKHKQEKYDKFNEVSRNNDYTTGNCCKDIGKFLFWELWECETISSKNIVSICRKLSCLPTCKKSNSSLASF